MERSNVLWKLYRSKQKINQEAREMVDDFLLAEGLKELLNGLVDLELRVDKIEKQLDK